MSEKLPLETIFRIFEESVTAACEHALAERKWNTLCEKREDIQKRCNEAMEVRNNTYDTRYRTEDDLKAATRDLRPTDWVALGRHKID